MINKYLLLLFLFTTTLLISGFIWISPKEDLNGKLGFGRGEVIEYKVHYGFLNAATGKMVISDSIFNMNGRPCYKIDVYGESTGMFDMMLKIRDNWGTYLDTEKIVPQRFWRNIREGKYRKLEIVDFDQKDQKATVVKYDFKKNQWRDKNYFDIPTRCQDMVSGYYYLRTMNFKKLRKNDLISLQGFFDDETYKFNIRYLGKEELKTKLGTYQTHVFAPVMPENGLFDGEDSIIFWLSDDEHKIPLRIRANMFVGAVEIDITSYKPSQH